MTSENKTNKSKEKKIKYKEQKSDLQQQADDERVNKTVQPSNGSIRYIIKEGTHCKFINNQC